MRVLYTVLPIAALLVGSFFVLKIAYARNTSLVKEDIIITSKLPNILSATPDKPAQAILDELGYYKTDLNSPIEGYYPFSDTTISPQLTLDELGLERVVITASLHNLNSDDYTFLHVPTPEQVVFDNGQVVSGEIRYVESAIRDNMIYLSFYRGAIRDYENPESKIRQEMQKIKLIRKDTALSLNLPLESPSIQVLDNKYALVELSSDQKDITLILNKKFDKQISAYILKNSFNSQLSPLLLKVFPNLVGEKINSKVSINGDKVGWEIKGDRTNSTILITLDELF